MIKKEDQEELKSDLRRIVDRLNELELQYLADEFSELLDAEINREWLHRMQRAFFRVRVLREKNDLSSLEDTDIEWRIKWLSADIGYLSGFEDVDISWDDGRDWQNLEKKYIPCPEYQDSEKPEICSVLPLKEINHVFDIYQKMRLLQEHMYTNGHVKHVEDIQKGCYAGTGGEAMMTFRNIFREILKSKKSLDDETCSRISEIQSDIFLVTHPVLTRLRLMMKKMLQMILGR